MAKGRGKGRGKGSKGGRRRRRGAAKGDGKIPLKVLENRLGKLSTIVAKRGGKLPRTYQ